MILIASLSGLLAEIAADDEPSGFERIKQILSRACSSCEQITNGQVL